MPAKALMRSGMLALALVVLFGAAVGDAPLAQPSRFSLRFHGNGANDIDRVKIRIDGPEVPADVGATDFTIEWWMKATPGENVAGAITPGSYNWIQGNILIDRDVYGAGDNGDYGVSVGNSRLAFGFGNSNSQDNTIVGSRVVADGQWHHVAVTRRLSDGRLQLYVDGALDASADGPDGDGTYRNGRQTDRPNSDPFIVIGAEKHDVISPGFGYRGWVDEMRFSNVLRYTSNFTRPSAPFVTDGSTVALYHFDEGGGTDASDVSGAPGGPSRAVVRVGGSPSGPQWSTDIPPFSTQPAAPAPPSNLRIIR